MIGLDGRELKQITSGSDLDYSPSVSSDGTQIAYTTIGPDSRGSDDYEIKTVSINGGRPKRLTDNEQHDVTPIWLPSGSQIAFVRDGNLHVMNSDGKNQRSLAPGLELGNTAPAWSPDGTKLVFLTMEQELAQVPWLDTYYSDRPPTLEVSSGYLVRYSAYVVWEDGTRLSKLEWTDDHTSPPRTRIGRGQSQPEEHLTLPVWSPDSRKLVFAAGFYGKSPELFFVAADGTGRRSLFTLENAKHYSADYISRYEHQKEFGTVDPILEKHGFAEFLDRHRFSDIFWSTDSKVLYFTATFDAVNKSSSLVHHPRHFAVSPNDPALREVSESEQFRHLRIETGRSHKRQAIYRRWVYPSGNVLSVTDSRGERWRVLVEMKDGSLVARGFE